MSVKEIRMSTGLTQRKFCAALGIPTRTLEDWERGVSRCPAYVEALIAYRVEHDPTLRAEGNQKTVGEKEEVLWKKESSRIL